MLEIKNIKKTYKTKGLTQVALNDVSIKFREHEFVVILGPSGSGKTTLLNILGGLDTYDSGDLIINGKSTKKFKDVDFDSYRNNNVGFIFQNYNLINHISILSNVEMSLKLSNVSKKIRKQKAISVLEKVGLKNHIYKKPNELSGGQMQRVAIARSLVNNPNVILADEPTGALDFNTSIEIMNLIKEISNEKLVVMVTHNKELASMYASRIINLKDGKVVSDSNPYKKNKNENKYILNKTKMNFFEAISLSFSNLMTKKGRTFLTALASSIGIVGITLILSISNGFNKQIEIYEKKAVSLLPITISEQSFNIDKQTLSKLDNKTFDNYPNIDYVIPQKNEVKELIKHNNITSDYINYLNTIDKSYIYGIGYIRNTNINFIQKDKNNNSYLIDTSNLNISSIPKTFNNKSFINIYYDVLAGKIPENKNEIVLIVDSTNSVDENILKMLNLDISKNIDFSDILTSTIRVVLNDDLYIKIDNNWTINTNFNNLYDKGITLKVVGIVRMKKDYPSILTNSGISYTEEFIDYFLEMNNNSKIVKEQEIKNYNILTGLPFKDEKEKENTLVYLGKKSLPSSITIYPKNFSSKEKLINYLDKYNDTKSKEDKIIYTDQAKTISNMSNSIINSISIILIVFSSISLIISSIMIGIITYISVLERTKEIGILRSLGARKKDITRIFKAETFIIGITSGILGILIAKLLIVPINVIIEKLTSLKDVALLNINHIIILVLISTILTMIGGFIPSKLAANKKPVESLRAE